MAKGDTPTDTSKKPSARRPRGTGSNFVYESLRAAMLNLELEPGTLLDETELARQFSVSRSPVREALIRLSAERLVTTLRNRSSVVASLDLREVVGFFDALDLMYRVTARRAATTATKADLERVRLAVDLHREAIQRQSIQDVIDSNREFHVAIAESCRNKYYVQWTRTLLDSGQRIQHLYWQRLGAHLSDDAHTSIFNAIAAGDADAAEAAARQDADLASRAIRAQFDQRQDSVGIEPLSSLKDWAQ